MDAKRVKASVEKMGEHCKQREGNTKARRANAVCLRMSFPSFPNSDWFLGYPLLK
jgi:hypothetical protein